MTPGPTDSTTHHHLFAQDETVRGHINNSIASLQETIVANAAFWHAGQRTVAVPLEDLTRLRDRLYIVKERVDMLLQYHGRIDPNNIVAQELKRVLKEHKL